MGFWLYILRCRDGTFYIGHTDDLERRIEEHKAGVCGGYTSKRRPVELVFCQEMPTREEALIREMQLKGWSHAKKAALTQGNWPRIRVLAVGGSGFPVEGAADPVET